MAPLTSILFSLLSHFNVISANTPRPNFLLVMCDDMDLLLGGVVWEVGAEGVDTGLGARLLLGFDVRLGVLTLADEHHGEA